MTNVYYYSMNNIANEIIKKSRLKIRGYYNTVMNHLNGETFEILVRLESVDNEMVMVKKIAFYTTMNGNERSGAYNGDHYQNIKLEDFKKYYNKIWE